MNSELFSASCQRSAADWQDILFPVFAATSGPVPRPDDKFQLWAGQKGVLSQASYGPLELVREPKPIQGRLLDLTAFRLLLSGSIDVSGPDARGQAAEGDLLIFNLESPFRLLCAEEHSPVSEITLWIPSSRFKKDFANGPHLGVQILSAIPAARIFAGALRALLDEAQRMGSSVVDVVADGFTQLAADVLATTSPSPARPDHPLQSYETVRTYIDANLGARDLKPATLARTFGLSRSSLYRLFEPVGGVAGYIRARRLERAHQEIKEPGLNNRRIAPAAYGSGFRSIAAFNRAYLQAYGETPRQSRRKPVSLAEPQTSAPKTPLGPLAKALLAIE